VHVYRLVTKNTVEERILRRARQKENVQSTVYGANLKADSFSTRDIVEMVIDDIDDPIANLGSNRNQVKGFIKTGGKEIKTGEKKKRVKKNKLGDENPVYVSIKKSDAHAKYENEIDDLLDGEVIENGVSKIKQQDVEMALEESEEASDISDDDAA